jgi:hypothetical protein
LPTCISGNSKAIHSQKADAEHGTRLAMDTALHLEETILDTELRHVNFFNG